MLILPDYENCLTNLSNSILKHYNIPTYHKTLDYIDNILSKNYKNVILILCDGMGARILDKVLDENSFLRKNKMKEITSVFPSTTTSATNSVLSGLNPNEHGWLGWDMYFKEENQTITMFLNTLKDTEIQAQDYNVANKYFKYESIIEKIKNTGNDAHAIYSFKDEKYLDFKNLTKDIIDLTKQNNNKKFIYAYYTNPDSLLHKNGINSELVHDNIKTINKEIEELCNNLEDSLIIVTADHGHIDCIYYDLDNYKEIKDTLERTTSLEPRVISFKIKEGKLEIFENLFNKHFSNEFILYTKEQIIENEIFGIGINNKYFNEELGDYIAIAKSNKCIIYSSDTDIFKSMHGALTEEEMIVPVIVKEIK